jgi:hypothetical protein
MELLPLGLVVRVLELARVRAFAGGFEFDESDEGFVNRDGVVGATVQVVDGRFADRGDAGSENAAQFRQIREQLLERGAKLVLGFAAGAGIGQLGAGKFEEEIVGALGIERRVERDGSTDSVANRSRKRGRLSPK